MANGNIIDISAFSSEIGSILSMYSNNVTETTENWLQITARRTARNVQAHARLAGFKVDAKYISGWTVKKLDGHYVVYNKNKPGLAHLLEHGHEIVVNGVSTGKRTRAFPHVKPAEEDINKYIQELEKQIGGIS